MRKFLIAFTQLIALVATITAVNVAHTEERPTPSKKLSDNIQLYSDNVIWMAERVAVLVQQYDKNGTADTNSLAVDWEQVAIHAAIENNFAPIYGSIWLSLFALKQAVDESAPIDAVRTKQREVEQALWQALGAIRLAADLHDYGLVERYYVRRDCGDKTVKLATTAKTYFDRTVAKACRIIR